MKELCRFDYVINAVEALNAYMETCATKENTSVLVQRAKGAIEALEKIEKEIRAQGIKRKQKEAITTSMEEFRRKHKKLKTIVTGLDYFLADHQKELEFFNALGKTFSLIEKTKNTLDGMYMKMGERAENIDKNLGQEND